MHTLQRMRPGLAVFQLFLKGFQFLTVKLSHFPHHAHLPNNTECSNRMLLIRSRLSMKVPLLHFTHFTISFTPAFLFSVKTCNLLLLCAMVHLSFLPICYSVPVKQIELFQRIPMLFYDVIVSHSHFFGCPPDRLKLNVHFIQ